MAQGPTQGAWREVTILRALVAADTWAEGGAEERFGP